MELSSEEITFLVKTACWTIRRRLGGAPGPEPVMPLNPNLMTPAGCFVSLYRREGHALRGCIGRIDSASPLLETLINSAWGAAQDPRLSGQPITTAELSELEIELSVLGQLKPAATPMDFEPKDDGIYLQAAGKMGVFLPQVARQTGWTREQLLDRLCQEKMGLPPQAWRSPGARLFVYPAQIIGPVAFMEDDSSFPPGKLTKIEPR
jgi:uncharacterized protein